MKRFAFLAILLTGLLYAGGAHGSALVRVKASEVCMVNNNYMGTPQIPVKVGERTYYGCCQGCKTTLQTKPESRVAVDPVSGQTVDKSVAIIGKSHDGKVFYFSSVAHFNRFQPKALPTGAF
jgi:YHS domain-containing protein